MQRFHPAWLAPLILLLAACDDTDTAQTPAADDAAPAAAPAATPPADPAVEAAPVSAAPRRDGCRPTGRNAITPGGIGAVRLGQPYEELREVCAGTPVQLQTEVHRGIAYKLDDGLHALLTDNKVIGILVEAAGPQTAGGLGIGSTVRDVRRAGDHVCAGVGATGVDVWQRNEGIVYSTSAASTLLTTDLARDRYKAASAVPDSAKVERILVGKVPFCEERPPASRWHGLQGGVEIFLLDNNLVTVAIDAAGLTPGKYALAIGPAASEGLRLDRSDYRVLVGRFDGRTAEPEGGALRIEVTVPRSRFGPDREGAVVLRADTGAPHTVEFALESDG